LIGVAFLGFLVAMGGTASTGTTRVPFSSRQYWLTQPQVIIHYIRLSFWPAPLCFDYDWPIAKLKDAWPSIIAVLILLTGSLWLLYKRHPVGFLATWFFAILGPTSLLPLTHPAWEYRMYLPLAALTVFMMFAVYDTGKKWQRRFVSPVNKPIKLVFWLLPLIISVIFGALTFSRNQVYRQGLIWQDAVQKAPRNSRAHLNLGVELDQAGKPYEAIRHFEEAIRLKPDYAAPPANMGTVLIRLGKTDDAIRYLKEAIRLEPNYAEAYSNMGVALGRAGRLHESIAEFEKALRLKPDSAEVHSNMGLVLGHLGRKQEAIGHLQEALRLKPDYQAARMNLELLMRIDRR
jgi:tetratricopeptide (TPR) repeat protein